MEAELTLQESNIEKLLDEVNHVKEQPFGIHIIEDNQKLMNLYTGLSLDCFKIICALVEKAEFHYYYSWRVESISLVDQVLITLMKLRLNLTYQDLGF